MLRNTIIAGKNNTDFGINWSNNRYAVKTTKQPNKSRNMIR